MLPYHRAYQIWKNNKDGKKVFDGGRDQIPGVNEHQRTDNYELGRYQSVRHAPDHTPYSDKDFWTHASAHGAGYLLEPDAETDSPTPQRTNMYLYGDLSPVKAR